MLASVGQCSEIVYRRASPSDALDVAYLHADSWRAHYRGAYADGFLDGEVVDDRVAFWTERLASEDEDRLTLIARSAERLVGFAHTGSREQRPGVGRPAREPARRPPDPPPGCRQALWPGWETRRRSCSK